MSEFDKRQHRDYSIFDRMSTDELKELLRQDSYQEENRKTDIDAILYITEVIAGREDIEKTNKVKNADAAWQEFKEKYMPQDGDGKSLYDFDDEDDEPEPKIVEHASQKKAKRGILWVIRIAAVITVLAIIGTVTASALGFNVWEALLNWGKKTFNISIGEPYYEKVIPEQLKELSTVLVNYGVPKSQLPSYIPDGYTSQDVYTMETNSSIIIACFLENNDSNIMIQYSIYSSAQNATDVQKNEPKPEIYESSGVKYYITNNYDIYNISWTEENIEGLIVTTESKDEVLKIINSIGG